MNLTNDFKCCSDDEPLEECVEEHKPARVIQGQFEGDLVTGIYKSRSIIERSKEHQENPTQRTSPFEYDTTTGD